MKYINYFFIYSILGHLLEKTLYNDHASGILYGYWTPIYGIGCLIIIGILKLINKKVNNKILKPIILFIASSITLSFIEYIGGILIERIFNFSFWDYTYMKYNIGKYTSIEMTLVWGISSIVLIYIIHPIISKIEKKIPKFVTYTLVFLFLFDILYKFIPKIKS